MLGTIVRVLVAVTLSAQLAPPAQAAPLDGEVPAGTLVYVGWPGGTRLAAAAEGTPAGELLDASNLPALFDEIVPGVADLVAEQDAEAGAVAGQVAAVVRAVADRPAALYVTGVEPGPALPSLNMGLVVDADDDAAAVQRALEELLVAGGGPGRVTRQGGLVLYTSGPEVPAAEGPRLADADGYRRAMAAVGGEDALTAIYIDVAGINALAADLIGQAGGEEALAPVAGVAAALGLGDATALATAGTFGDDGLWHSRTFLATDRVGDGLPGVFAGAADLSLLDVVPADAVQVRLERADAGVLVDVIEQAVAAADPEAGPQYFRQALGMADTFSGVDVRRDVIGNLGETWLAYRSPRVGGGPAGLVAVNKLKDAAAFERALGQASVALVNGVNAAAELDRPRLVGRSTTIEGVKVYYLGTPLVAPAWAVHDGHLFAGFYPQMVAAAANLAGEGGFRNTPAAGRALALAGETPRGLSFYDMPAVAPDLYSTMVSVAQTASGFYDLFGGGSTDPLLPTLPTVLANLSPAAGASWADGDGLHFHMAQPFPLSTALPEQQQSITQTAPLISILLPSLERARETANRVASASNLRLIGLAAILYANEVDGGAFPATLGEIYRTQDVPAESFLNPRTGNELPWDWDQATPEQRAAWIDNAGDYLWLGDGLTLATPADVVAGISRPAGLDDGVNVLYADASVYFLTWPQLDEEIARTNAYRFAQGLPELFAE